jgi:hypothetical protein
MPWYDTFLKKGTLRLYAAKEVGRLVPECNPFLSAHVFVIDTNIKHCLLFALSR